MAEDDSARADRYVALADALRARYPDLFNRPGASFAWVPARGSWEFAVRLGPHHYVAIDEATATLGEEFGLTVTAPVRHIPNVRRRSRASEPVPTGWLQRLARRIRARLTRHKTERAITLDP
jgi:hypothetical protein